MPETGMDRDLYIRERGIAALGGTRGWATFVGVIALVSGVLGIINVMLFLASPRSLFADMPARFAGLRQFLSIAVVVWNVVVYGLVSWFALAFARALATNVTRSDGGGLETALWWQRRYWTLQGVLTIVAMVVFVLALLLPLVLFALSNSPLVTASAP